MPVFEALTCLGPVHRAMGRAPTFTQPRDSFLREVAAVEQLLTLSLRKSDGRVVKNSSELARELALLKLHEAWSDFVEETFRRILQKADAKNLFRPVIKPIVISRPRDDEVDDVLKDFKGEAFPQSFGSSPHVVKASNRWFGSNHPLKWLDDVPRRNLLEAARLLRNDVGHGGGYSSKSEQHMPHVFQPGSAPERAQRVTVGFVLNQTAVRGHPGLTLIEALSATMKAGAAQICTDATNWS